MMKSIFRRPKKGERLSNWEESKYGKFNKAQLIGRGAYGKVHLFWSPHRDKRVAVKVFLKDKSGVFENECAAYKKISNLEKRHPNICEFLGAFKGDDERYIVLGYCELGTITVNNVLKYFPNYKEDLVRDIVFQASKALLFVLEKLRMCHRDVKPGNILISSLKPFQIKICDFNSAKQVKGLQTQMQSDVGTDYFKAPEIEDEFFRNEDNKYSYKADIFSLGVVAYSLYMCQEGGLDEYFPRRLTKPAKFLGEEGAKKYLEEYDLNTVIFYPREQFAKVSENGTDLLKRMLNPHYKSRYDYRQILEHPWKDDNFENAEQIPVIYVD